MIGAINGTHIPIQAPSTHEYLFLNRKKRSFNKCDSSLRFQFEIFEFGSKFATGWILLFRPERACGIVTAYVVLLNICINNNVPVPRNRNNYRVFQTMIYSKE